MLSIRLFSRFLICLLLGAPALAGQDSLATAIQLIDDGDYTAAVQILAELPGREARLREGIAWYEQDSLDRALAIYQQLTHDTAGREIQDSVSMAAYGRSAFILRRRLGRGAAGLQARERAAAVGRAWAPERNDVLMELNYRLGNAGFFMDDFDVARRALRLADYYASRMPAADTTAWIDALRLLGNIVADDYDADLIRSVTRKSTRLFERQVNKRYILLGREIYLDGADALIRIEDARPAIAFADKGLKIAREMGEIFGIVRALNIAANAYKMVGKLDQSKAFYQEALQLIDAADDEVGDASFIYSNLGRMYQQEGQYELAEQYLKKSIDATSDVRSAEFLPSRLADHAQVLTLTGGVDQGLERFNEAIRLISNDNTVSVAGYEYALLDSVNFIRELISVYESRARSLFELNLLEPALANYDRLFEVQDRLRQRQVTEGSLRFTSNYYHGAYQRAIESCYRLYLSTNEETYLWRALAYGERAKAYGLRAALQREAGLMPEAEQSLRDRIARLNREVLINPDAYIRLDSAMLALRQLLSQDFTKSAEQGFSLADLRASLRKSPTEVYSYHLGDSTSFVIHLPASGGIRMQPLPSRDSLARTVERWRASIINGAYRGKSLRTKAEQHRQDSTYLYQGRQLLTQLMPGLNTEEGTLLIVPDASLGYLPFAALPLTETAPLPLDYGAITYLGERKDLSYAYSLDHQRQLNKRPTYGSSRNISAFAPSFAGRARPIALRGISGGAGLAGETTSRRLPALSPLRFNVMEVNAISQLVPSARTFVGREATREQFLREIRDSKVLHLSTHGMVDPTEPALSFVAFGSEEDATRAEDLLFFNDLTNLPVKTELAVLAACETSLGRIARGESVLSMASAFMAAGAKSTLTSLWQVDDEATMQLMVAFYRHLAAGESRSAALRLAQEEQRLGDSYAHPYFWSGMVVHGQRGPIAFESGWSGKWGLALAAVALLGLGGWFFFRTPGK